MPADYPSVEWDAALEADCSDLVKLALREDLYWQEDWTTTALVARDRQGAARIVARQAGVIAGLRTVGVVLSEARAQVTFEPHVEDGETVAVGACVGVLQGAAADILTCERTVLNLLGRLCGVATLTRRFVDAVAGTDAEVYDTRKTTPGWRRLEKHAVRCGGGRNHRMGLYDAILIKDNHLALAAEERLSPADAVERARRAAPDLVVEVEVDNLEQLAEVLAVEPDIVLLDNMTPLQLKAAIEMRNAASPGVVLEASGGVRLETIRAIAETGVERISAGALTHSAVGLDLALDWGAAAVIGDGRA